MICLSAEQNSNRVGSDRTRHRDQNEAASEPCMHGARLFYGSTWQGFTPHDGSKRHKEACSAHTGGAVCLFVVLWRYQAIIDEVRAGLKWLGVTVSSRTATARDKGKKRRKKGQVCIEVLRLFRFAGAILCYFFGAATHVRHPAMHQVEVEKAGGPGTPHTCMLGTPGNRP